MATFVNPCMCRKHSSLLHRHSGSVSYKKTTHPFVMYTSLRPLAAPARIKIPWAGEPRTQAETKPDHEAMHFSAESLLAYLATSGRWHHGALRHVTAPAAVNATFSMVSAQRRIPSLERPSGSNQILIGFFLLSPLFCLVMARAIWSWVSLLAP